MGERPLEPRVRWRKSLGRRPTLEELERGREAHIPGLPLLQDNCAVRELKITFAFPFP